MTYNLRLSFLTPVQAAENDGLCCIASVRMCNGAPGNAALWPGLEPSEELGMLSGFSHISQSSA